MKCPFCRQDVEDGQPSVALEGGLRAHKVCYDNGQPARPKPQPAQPGQPFRETTSLSDRGPGAARLKERELRE